MYPSLAASIGNVPLTLRPLVSKQDQRQGYMGHTVPPGDHEGLLFVHDEPCRQSYWMKNVPFDLDCLGFDEDNRLVEVMNLKAHATASRSFMRAVQHVVEVRGGWCRDKGVDNGSLLDCGGLFTNTMKLGPILFAEAAKTATEALGEGLVAITNPTSSYLEIVLLNKQAAEENLDTVARLIQQGKSSPQTLSGIMDSKGAVVGYLSARKTTPKLWKVDYSAAEHGYGPMLYQLAMTMIGSGNWLKASETLSNDSASVWNKMYELTWTGVYVKKFLGQIPDGETWVQEAFNIHPRLQYGSQGSYENFRSQLVSPSKDIAVEENTLRWLDRQGLEPEDVGYLWAYQLESPAPDAKKLMNAGKKLLASMPKEFGISAPDALEVIVQGGARLFGRMYRG